LNVERVIAIVLFALIYSCQNTTDSKNPNSTENKADTTSGKMIPLRDKVLTAEEQKALTPDMVIQSLVEGNKSFVSSDLTARDHAGMEHFMLLGSQKVLLIQSNRPLLRAKGLKHRHIDYKLLHGDVVYHSLLEDILKVVGSYITNYESAL
jgi:hypothetical protein